MSDFMNPDGSPTLVTLTADGSVPVETGVTDSQEGTVIALLNQIAWEMAETRKLLCWRYGAQFLSYDGSAASSQTQ
jgi:hypothetical protein